MGEIASPGQLRMSFVRWTLVTVPAVEFLGFLSGRMANSGEGNAWFAALAKPVMMPPGWLFGAAWAVLYALIAIAFAMVLNARGAKWRPTAIVLFTAQLALNLAWSPLFFAGHRVLAAFVLLLVILAAAAAATAAFARVRAAAAWLMLPYLAWLAFASLLNWQIHRLNPAAESLAVDQPAAHIEL